LTFGIKTKQVNQKAILAAIGQISKFDVDSSSYTNTDRSKPMLTERINNQLEELNIKSENNSVIN
jgi:hypothetical protein